MWHESTELLDVGDDFGQLYRPKTNDLPQILPRFFVPPLEDKPQNPILEALKLESINSNLPPRLFQLHLLPQELTALSLNIVEPEPEAKVEEIWKNALIRRHGVRNGLLSWDRLRPTHSDKASSTAFLSEQDRMVLASARHYVQPRLYDAKTSFVFVTEQELLVSLKMTVLGISSPLHTWDSFSERFVQSGTKDNRMEISIIIDGKDEIVSSSIIAPFLTIGTLLRRLESLLMILRSRSAKEGPTIHAFAHSLSSALVYIRQALAGCPPSSAQVANGENLMLSEICCQHSIYEDLLAALAALCNRSEQFSPENYPQLDSSPNPLLSHICESLKFHIECQSPAIIRATIAFILTGASQEYINEVGRSVGFGGQPPQGLSKVLRETGDRYQLDADEEEREEDIFDLLDKVETTFPTFFPQNLLKVLPAAQKSLVLLRIAQPDHSLLNTPMRLSPVRWLWTLEEIMAAFDNRPLPSGYDTLPLSIPLPLSPVLKGISYKPELSGFHIFDLEPGHYIGEPSLKINDSSAQLLHAFIDNFPRVLPSITPTFSELTALVFKDLVHHASSLSSTLLSLFITSTDNLNFHSHLVLLRSYLLLAAPSFKSRLLAALFSDAGEYEIDQSPHSISIRSLRRKPGKKVKESTQPWAVGLSPNLLDRETWPPVGADLSFFLRTVIVDSLEKGKENEEGLTGHEPVTEEAGWRLGFAIRDLPTGPGHDKWLNPLSIEALDFLYMDYKPPRPLEILISSDILSKYQRMFTFILRLLRVESALKSLFRMSTHRSTSNFLFPTLTKSRKLLLHFRFLSQAFVSSLSGYIFDTAIGGNYDPFLARLSSCDLGPPNSLPNERTFEFSDVFELAQCHSTLLDDILSACLLRSGQKGVGELLRHSLELVLEFTIVVGELHRGRLEEYHAAPLIEDLFQRFRTKMTTLTKVLKGLVEKSPSPANWPADVSAASIRRPTGGLDALYHLLIRLDLSDWWSKTKQ